ESGAFLSDEDADDGNHTAEGNDANAFMDEEMLRDAVRSATQMLAAEGFGDMANVDFTQQQASDVLMSLHRPRDTYNTGADLFVDGESSAPLAAEQRSLTAPGTAAGRRGTRARRINYNDDVAFGALEGDDPAAFIPDSIDDDDEDGNYEGFDGSAGVKDGFGDEDDDEYSSDNSEYHMMVMQRAAQEQSSFASARKSAHKTRGKRGRPSKADNRAGGGRSRKQPQAMYSPQVQRLLGVANQNYVMQNLEDAFAVFSEVLRLDPTCGAAWKTMALIRGEQGKSSDALQLYTVAALMTPTDTDLWEQLYSMHKETISCSEEAANAGDPAAMAAYQEAIKQALLCIDHIIRYKPEYKASWWLKLDLLERAKNHKGMVKVYRSMLNADPYHMETIRKAAVFFAQTLNDVDTPVQWFVDAFDFYNRQAITLTRQVIAKSARGKNRNRRRKGANSENAASDEDDSDLDFGGDGNSDEGGSQSDGSESWAQNFLLHPDSTVSMVELDGYTYGDINMFAELRLRRSEYSAVVVDIKRSARFVQGRGRAAEWEGRELSDEFDLEYPVDAEASDAAPNELPIDLRVKLGQCRLMLDQGDSAAMHFDQLREKSVVGFDDLFMDVGETCMECGQYEVAIDIYERLRECPETNGPLAWECLAKCYRELRDLATACEFGQEVIKADPGDINMRLWLCEVYEEMGQQDLAFEMVRQAEAIQAEEQAQAAVAAAATAAHVDASGPEGLNSSAMAGTSIHGAKALLSPEFEVHSAPSAIVQFDLRKPSEVTQQRRRDAEAERSRYVTLMRNAEVAFKKLDLIKPRIDNCQGSAAIKEYCETAQRLYADWRRIGAFRTTDRTKPFRNYRNYIMTSLEGSAKEGSLDLKSAAAGQTAVQTRLAKLKKRLSKKKQAADSVLAAADDKDDFGGSTTFRGLPFDRWLDMFLMYGKCLTLGRAAEKALDMLEFVFMSNVFHSQPDKRRVIRLVMLSIAINAHVDSQLYAQMRWWCGPKPTGAIMYKLLAYVMAGSIGAMTVLTASNMYKFVRRLLDLIDEAYYSKIARNGEQVPDGLAIFGDISDESTQVIGSISDEQALTRSDVAAVHMVAAHIMSMARPGVTSMMQYTLALALVPCDATAALHAGVAYLVCSSKRSSRGASQSVLIKGLMFLQRYAELRFIDEMKAAGEYDADAVARKRGLNPVATQEIAYNFARAFHFIGMLELATEYYYRVFDLPISRLAESGNGQEASMCDLRSEAAYNLASLYVGSGAVLKARDILRKYCTI
ncbi:transcription factor TFIIIC subunit tfc4, partial [Coemansia thaxteri]